MMNKIIDLKNLSTMALLDLADDIDNELAERRKEREKTIKPKAEK